MADGTCQKKEHLALVEQAIACMPTEEEFAVTAARFKLLGEVCRLKILAALRGGALCVEHLAKATGATQSATSHQLRILKDNGLVRAKREGKSMLYSLADGHVQKMMETGLLHARCGGEE